MHIAFALTHESILSTVASAYDLVEYCERTRTKTDAASSVVFAVTSGAEQRYGFLQCLSPRTSVRADWVFVPALDIVKPWMPSHYAPLARWIRDSAERGALVTSVGTGAFLVAAASLLHGKEAATYSPFCDYFSECYPDVPVNRDSPWVRHPGLLMSGDMPWPELVLHVLAQHCGAEVARRAADTYAINWNELIDPPQRHCVRGDRSITRAQRWLAQHYPERDLVTRCTEYLGLSKRTFNRRFKDETGTTPTEFVQCARIRASQNLLLSTERRVEDICLAVGYEDIATFRKLFRKRNGVPPGQFRKRNGVPPDQFRKHLVVTQLASATTAERV
jgi:transcriptional regulator GlxA family with amidase domain